MDKKHLRRQPGVGELPQRAYPERGKFPIYTPEAGNATGQSSVEIANLNRYVRQARMVNYVQQVTTDGLKMLSENFNRAYLFIQVKSTSPAGLLYINYGEAADATVVEIESPSGYYEFPIVPINSIWLRASTGTMLVVVTEGSAIV